MFLLEKLEPENRDCFCFNKTTQKINRLSKYLADYFLLID